MINYVVNMLRTMSKFITNFPISTFLAMTFSRIGILLKLLFSFIESSEFSFMSNKIVANSRKCGTSFLTFSLRVIPVRYCCLSQTHLQIIIKIGNYIIHVTLAYNVSDNRAL